MATKRFPTLYKINSKGKVQQWEIVVSNNMFFTTEGDVDGKLTSTLPTVCKAKRGTTAEQQALKEAEAKIKAKIGAGYAEKLEDAIVFFQPMLAKKIEDYGDLLFTVPTYIQPKLDGIRCVSEKNTLMSRKGKPFIATPHLQQDRYLLDGELYNHDLREDFNQIVSITRKKKVTVRDLQLSKEQIQFHIYDLPMHEGVFSDRYKALSILFSKDTYLIDKGYRLVPTYAVKDLEELNKYHEQFLSEGYEGSIVRLDLANYENKRTNQLLKKKEWQDEEFIIQDVIEGIGNRTGTVGKLMFKTKEGKEFGANVKGDFDYLRLLFKIKDSLIGIEATVKFFQLTPDGIPRFPLVIKLNRNEYE